MNKLQTHYKRKIKGKVCVYCRATENLTIDHKIPTIQGGTDDVKNLQTLCFKCNSLKSGMSDKQVRSIWKWHNEVNKLRELAGKEVL